MDRRKGGFVFNMGPQVLYAGEPAPTCCASLALNRSGGRSALAGCRLLNEGQLHRMPAARGSVVRTTVMGHAAKAQFARLLGELPIMRPARLAGTSVLLDTSPRCPLRRPPGLPASRPSLAEVAQAAAELDGDALAGEPALIRRAAKEIVAVRPWATADDVLVYAAGLRSRASA